MKRTNNHILNAASMLIGVNMTIVAIINSLKVDTIADDILIVGGLIFIVAILFSYLSIRNNDNFKLEQTADIIFLIGICILMVSSILILLRV